MSTTCARCGAVFTDEAPAFCGSCGAPLAATNPSTEFPRSFPVETPLAPPAGAPGSGPQKTIPEAPLSSALVPLEPTPAPGAPRDKPAIGKHLAPGTLIDKKYAVLRVLGEGGMGVVYLARDIHTGLDVVVKAVRAELAHRSDVRARTLSEGRALAQIDHPNVVHLRAVAVDGPNLFLVMQYIEGDGLDKIIARYAEKRAPMPLEEALSIFRQIAAGVAAAHEEGVIHRDLKPANVIVRRKDRVAKVTDFGIALIPADQTRPQTRGVLGSLWYMSPEQVVGRRDLDLRVDIYALGVMLYQMLVGRVPFDAKTDYEIMRQQAEAPMPLASAARPDLPPGVDELIQKACAKDREQRFQRCDELVAAVDRLMASTASEGWRPLEPNSAQIPPGLTPPIPLVKRDAGEELPDVPDPFASVRGGSDHEEPVAVGVIGGVVGAASVVAPTMGPPPMPKRRWVGAVIALAVLVALAGGTALALGFVPGVPGVPALVALLPSKRPRHVITSPPPPPKEAPPPAIDAGAVKSMLDALAGQWVGHGRELEAVLTGHDLEFRVKRPDQFPTQGYEVGEARFILHATSEPNVFTVEDRVRPVPPTGKVYDPKARASCQEVWTSVGGDPLRARFEATKLSVEFARIEPVPANFTVEGNRVTGCVGLRDAKASKIKNTLSRP